jgi:sugar lactone lactonase YvrE
LPAKLNAQVKILNVQPVTGHKCLLGESPLWDHHKKMIVWIDILRGEIHEYIPDKKLHRTLSVGEFVGSVGLCRGGDLIAALHSGFGIINRSTGAIKKIASPEDDLDNRFNDGKCDPAGRYYAGTMSMSKQLGKGSFYKLEKDGSVRKILTRLSIPNGMAWSIDHCTFYHIDTPTSQICAYDYDISTGSISNRRAIITIPPGEGPPDGMTIDADGMLWIAHWNGGKISRWNPGTGNQILSILLPVSNVTSLTFGGDDFSDIYITSATASLNEEQVKQQPLAGSIFLIKQSGFRGLKTFEFADI